MVKKDCSEKALLEKLKTYLNYRAHSEHELKTKLLKHFPQAAVRKALKTAKQNRWLSEPKELALQFANELHRKKKGWLSIQIELKKKQLPLVQKKEILEEEKCRWWLIRKFSNTQNPSKNTNNQMRRFLMYKGFESTTIKKIIHEHIKKA